MISTSTHLSFHVQSPRFSSTTLPFIQFREFRIWRRTRLKKLTVSSQLTPFDNLFQNLISVNSSEFIAPVLGLAAGAALYLSRYKSNRNVEVCNLGDWILLTNPTPFNRFVLLRCPSLLFEGSELLEDLNEKLVKEDRHFVKLIRGKIEVKDLAEENDDFEKYLVYQRTCVSTGDGGVISLDWPEKLDLREEHGMDTTVLLIPGTTDGSASKNIRSFVCECLRRGCFPVVMNPRGCAGSPLTTARLFTAADSDDICTAIQFINKSRPWNTLMAIGWGQGANMLTKHLAEVEERTPLTAATCIDNPFDLEEATRSFPYHVAVDQKLTSGLIDILRSNKELFQGRAKTFNVEKALSATSLRDFEREISMVSYGFESIEEFYSKSSTRELVGNVKIPLLFIQSDDGTVPPFSIPRSSVAENPFTSMLLCSCLPSTALTSKKSVLPWCQQFAIEWLTAVELGLLKGRHPLLKDVDVTINPSAGLTLVESRASLKDSGVNNILNVTEMDTLNGYPVNSVENDRADHVHLGSQRNISQSAESQQGENHGMLEQSGSDDTALVDEAGENSDNERSQVLQSAQVVMNMLDVTMPGTLQEEQKKKVLAAMEQGETLMKALEGALPEDVRGKLTSSVSEIVKTKGTKLNLHGIMNSSLVPVASSEVKSKVQETFIEFSSATVDSTDVSSPGKMILGAEMPDGMENHPPERELDIQPALASEESLDNDGDIQIEKAGGPNAVVGEQEKVNQDDDITQMSPKESDDVKMNAETNLNDSIDKDRPSSTTNREESLSPVTSSPEPPLVEEEMNHNQKDDDKNVQPMGDQDKQGPPKSEEPAPSPAPTSSGPSFNVSQALDALSGSDDATQVAVNSVFGVLENMIAKLEEKKGQEIDGKQDKRKDKEPRSASEESSVANKSEDIPRNKENNKSRSSLEVDQQQYKQHVNNSTKSPDLHQDEQNNWDEKKFTQNYSSSLDKNSGNSTGSSHSDNEKHKRISIGSSRADNEKHKRMDDIIDSTLSAKTLNKVAHICKLPLCMYPYGDSMYNEYLRRRLLSEMPNSKPLDLNSTADLLLDYFPEEGQWKLLDQTETNRESDDVIGTQTISGRGQVIHSPQHDIVTNEIIETSYVILDRGKEQQPIKEYKTEEGLAKEKETEEPRSELNSSVKSIVLDSLKVEVGRRLGLPDLKEMESNLALDMDHVAEVVSQAVETELTRSPMNGSTSGEVGPLLGEKIIQTISLAANDSIYLKKVLPAGVIVGSTLAALKKYFSATTQHDNGYSRGTFLDHSNNVGKKLNVQVAHKLIPGNSGIDSSVKPIDKPESVNNDKVMVGAVTAALGASALFAHQQRKHPLNCDESVDVSSGSCNKNEDHPKEHENILDEDAEKDQNHKVSSLAEKAMSVAGPVIPKKSDGGLDQERLVAMLSDLGQKGGILRMIGKLALLWGGIRGAMSLTDRLISFLHIADRPLFQRLLGFACMVLVLWSPVVIPLFPTLVQGWATHNSSGIAEYACLIGLYTAVTILVILWGKRIRGYENPLEQYGLDVTSTAKLVDFSKGLMGGFMLVLSIHSINALLGCAHYSLAPSLPSSSPDTLLKTCGRLLVLAGRGIVTATFVVIVEEIIFRAWLPQEISVDFGYHYAVIISGFAFSILQRSLHSIPGLWLMSIALSGLRERSGGSLSIPIGMRAGILSSSFILRTGGLLTYHSSYPLWLAGTQPFQPFGGAVGLAFCIMLAMLLYPKQPLEAKNIQKVIQE